MPERRGDAQRFGPQAFESRSLRRFIDAGFSFHIWTVGVLRCSHTDRESFVYTTVQQTDFSLPHGLQRALLSMDIISANRLSNWTMENCTLCDLRTVEAR